MENKEEKCDEQLIPYVFARACPDYKRPYVHITYGVLVNNNYELFFIEKIVDEVIFDGINKVYSVDDIKYFFENFYCDTFMDNPPYDIRFFINGKWDYYHAEYKEIYDFIVKNRKDFYEVSTQSESTQSESEQSESEKLDN